MKSDSRIFRGAGLEDACTKANAFISKLELGQLINISTMTEPVTALKYGSGINVSSHSPDYIVVVWYWQREDSGR